MCWQLFPKSARPVPEVEAVCQVFSKYHGQFSSDSHDLDSNSVLRIVARELKQCGFAIEEGKSAAQKIHVPVLFGENGSGKSSICEILKDISQSNSNSKQ